MIYLSTVLFGAGNNLELYECLEMGSEDAQLTWSTYCKLSFILWRERHHALKVV